MKAFRPRLCLLLLIVCFYACSPLISRYNEYVYQQTTSLKVDALKVMDLAADSFATHKAELTELQTRIEKVYEYELHRPNNSITLEMWQTLKDPSKNLLGGYFARWQQQHKLDTVFIGEAKLQVGAAFDKIAELESGKIKEKDLK
jgi:hypothetical protein